MLGVVGQAAEVDFWVKLLDPAYLEAIAKVLWPIATVIVVLMLRSHLQKFIDRVRKAKAFGAEVELQDEVIQLKTATTRTLMDKKVIELLRGAGSPRAPRVPTTRAEPKPEAKAEPTSEVLNHISRPTITQDDDPFLKPLGEQGREIVGEQARLLSRVVEDSVLRDVKSKLESDPLVAISLIGVALERALKSAAIATGLNPRQRRPRGISGYAEHLSQQFDLGPNFEIAVDSFWETRDRLAHQGSDTLPPRYIRKMAEAGMHLLEIAHRLPVLKYYIEEAGIEVFSDEECTQRVPDIEGVIIVHAAMPGMTGHLDMAVTRNIGTYTAGDQVTFEWHQEFIRPWPLWAKAASWLRPQQVTKRAPFDGQRIADLQ